MGKIGELGEIAGILEKHIWYGQPLDEVNLLEEFGDDFWYTAEGINALGANGDIILKVNIQKLKKRFPEMYTDELALETNRDRVAERQIIEEQIHKTLDWAKESLVQVAKESGVTLIKADPDEIQRQFKERLGILGCTCTIVDFDFPNPTVKYSKTCPIHSSTRSVD